jgi:hypothetical protein
MKLRRLVQQWHLISSVPGNGTCFGGDAGLQRCGNHTVPSAALAAGGFAKIRIKPIKL